MLRGGIWAGVIVAGFAVGCSQSAAPPPAGLATGGSAASAANGEGFALVATAGLAGQKFTLENAKIEFTGSKDAGKHQGGFNEFVGIVVPADGDALVEKIAVDIDTTSLWADDQKLAGHLMNQDFFDVKQFPTATFVTTSIEPAAGDGTHKVKGDLTLHGVTKSIEFPATIAKHGDHLDFSADFEISRREFGITYGAGQIHDPVKIKASFTVPAD
jgi:polyisoprenoid-binding protein YceI